MDGTNNGGNNHELLFGANDYEANFAPKTYLEIFYAAPTGTGVQFEMINFVMQHLSTCLNGLSGKKILDLGCGPCLARAIPISRNYEEVVLADFMGHNLAEIKRWLDESPEAFNWDPFLKFYADEETPKGTVKEIAQRVRSRVKRLVRCDALNDQIVDVCGGPFDAIISTFFLEAACKTVDDLKNVLRKIYDSLLPGGDFILVITLMESYFSHGGHKYFNLRINHLQVLQLLEESRFQVVKAFYERLELDELGTSDCEGIMVVQATKSSQ